MLIGHEAIAALIPHAGRMCLLDRVTGWDADSIRAAAIGHRDPANPLRRDGLLPAVCGVEYALQAMAVHGALIGGEGEPQPPGYLASLRNLTLGTERLDDVGDDLLVEATALAREARSFIYSFTVAGGGRVLLAGQAAIIIPEQPA